VRRPALGATLVVAYALLRSVAACGGSDGLGAGTRNAHADVKLDGACGRDGETVTLWPQVELAYEQYSCDDDPGFCGPSHPDPSQGCASKSGWASAATFRPYAITAARCSRLGCTARVITDGETQGIEVTSANAGVVTIAIDVTLRDVDPAYAGTAQADVTFASDGTCE
jgi:hypothetical protein